MMSGIDYTSPGIGKMLEQLLGSATRVFSRTETPNHSTEMEERFLTDQQRIIRLLSEHDGRMWQRELIEETDWSPSKMSRRLSEMEEMERIVRIQIGREKLITVPESTAIEQGRSNGQSVTSDQFSQ